MGTYATTTAVFTKMVGTTADTATTALCTAMIVDAENEIEKMLAKRYDFTASPFDTTTTIPPIITTLTETLALGYMYENMARGSKEGYARADRYIKRAMDNLKMIADGELDIVDADGDVITVIDGPWKVYASSTNYSPTFNEDDPTNWEVDADKLTDIKSDRD